MDWFDKPFSAEFFMEAALQEARAAAACNETPIGAVITCGGKTIARAHNWVERFRDPTAHAEILAITAACHHLGAKYLRDCTIYITLEPCPMCAAALRWAQIGALVYGAPDPKSGYARFSKTLPHPKTRIFSGVGAEKSARLLKEFFYAKRK